MADHSKDEDLDTRIRRRAHQIWKREGRPDGRHDDHWALAREEIAIEDNFRATLKPNPAHGPDDTAVRTEPVEPALSIASQGEMPGLADQGKEFRIPGVDPDSDGDISPGEPEEAAAAVPAAPASRRTRRRA